MTVASTRVINIGLTGDVIASFAIPSAVNALAPGDVDIVTLAIGFNAIPLPTGGSTPRGATIVPPTTNIATITLKGVTGDTGIPISKVDPTSISFDAAAPPASFGLTASALIDGVRIYWT